MTACRAHFHLEMWRRLDDPRSKIGPAAYFLRRFNTTEYSTEMSGDRRLRNSFIMPALADLVRDRDRYGFSTTIFPVIFGWIEQK